MCATAHVQGSGVVILRHDEVTIFVLVAAFAMFRRDAAELIRLFFRFVLLGIHSYERVSWINKLSLPRFSRDILSR
jgi:hypothetical protein